MYKLTDEEKIIVNQNFEKIAEYLHHDLKIPESISDVGIWVYFGEKDKYSMFFCKGNVSLFEDAGYTTIKYTFDDKIADNDRRKSLGLFATYNPKHGDPTEEVKLTLTLEWYQIKENINAKVREHIRKREEFGYRIRNFVV